MVIVVLSFFTIFAVLPWGRQYPIPHLGNLFTALIISYAVLRHHLIDIKIVVRNGTAWFSLAIFGLLFYYSSLTILHNILNFQMDASASIIATLISLAASISVFKIKDTFFSLFGRAFQGERYRYRQKLTEFTDKIHNIFSLKEQGGELLALLTQAVMAQQSCILFREVGGDDFIVQLTEPNNSNNPMKNLRIRGSSPIIKYLEKQKSILTRDSLEIQPVFMSMWPQERDDIMTRDIRLFVPMISREKLIAILILGERTRGRYTLEDISIVEEASARVAVSMEKEYLREQLREREEEISVINNCSTILASSLDIQQIFEPFVEELKRIVDVSWASIVMLQDDELYCVALSASENAEYQVGDVLPVEGTGAGWVISHRTTFLETDLQKDFSFGTGETHRRSGLRTIVYLPLIAKNRAIGCLISASQQPHAYTQRHIKLFEQLASQIAMPLENSQLYADAEKRARVDELTGLLNRRSLDEMLDDEISRHSRYGGNFSLAIIDLDHFKTYNDTYGHLSGDNLLRDVGKYIRTTIRGTDRAFRYGGDEFAVLLPHTEIADAIQVAERVRQKIGSSLETGSVKISASIGIACWPHDGVSHTEIIDAADMMLYKVKRSGRNRTGHTTETDTIQFSQPQSECQPEQKMDALMQLLTDSIDTKNHFPAAHSLKVAEYSIALGKALQLDDECLGKLETSAMLVDIGQMCINETILNKQGSLTDDERRIFESHPQLGAALVGKIPEISHCQAAILHHHERYDGAGYPDGLQGQRIPLDARIIGLTSAFVAMMTERSYAPKLTQAQAIEELRTNAGTQFDPEMVEHFIMLQQKTAAAAGAAE